LLKGRLGRNFELVLSLHIKYVELLIPEKDASTLLSLHLEVFESLDFNRRLRLTVVLEGDRLWLSGN
jgi:hypothetical protein